MRSPRLRGWTLLLLVACAPSAEPARLDYFATNSFKVIADGCKPENDGKRYVLEGHIVASTDAQEKDGAVGMDMYEAIDAAGQGVGPAVWITLRAGQHVDLGPATAGSELDARAVKLRTSAGDATAKDRLKVLADLIVTHRFQNGTPAACEVRVVELHRRAPG